MPGAKPLFIEEEIFKTVIPLQLKTFGDFAETFQKWLELPDETLLHLQKGLASVALPATISDASWEELLLHLVSSWHQKGTQLPAIGMPENQVFMESEIKNVPSWQEKTYPASPKKSLVFNKHFRSCL